MKTEVPLWGMILTGFTMLFAVAFHQLGCIETMHFFAFVSSAFFWALFSFLACLAFIVALAYGLGTFLEGLKRVPGTRYQWHFLNCLLVSFVFIVVGSFFVWGTCFVWSHSMLLTLLVDEPFAEFSFFEMYASALLVSLCLRAIRKNWLATW